MTEQGKNKVLTALDSILVVLLIIFVLLKILTCLSGCGDLTEPPQIDGGQSNTYIDAGILLPDSHQVICGDKLCEYPWETMTDCPKDCLPKGWKFDDPLSPYDPGYIDPIDPPWRK